jgi:hypothetical protein
MVSLNNLIVRAQRVGRNAADLAHDIPGDPRSTGGDAHLPGEDAARLILAAYRSFGIEETKAVVRGYQAGYNTRAAEHGDFGVRWIDLKVGISWALPGATEDEQRTISAAL